MEKRVGLKDIMKGELVPLLKLSVQTAYEERKELDFDSKLQLIKEDFRIPSGPGEFEESSAHILETLKKEKEILDWVPVKRRSVLDSLLVDFIVVRNNGMAVCLQVTSTPSLAKKRRSKIEDFFEILIIATVNFKSRGGIRFEDKKMENLFKEKMNDTSLIEITV